jgi:hypothetical protein
MSDELPSAGPRAGYPTELHLIPPDIARRFLATLSGLRMGMWKVTVSLVALALLTPEGSQRSPRSLLAAAGAGPVSFTEALASNHQAAGLVARESDIHGEHAQGLVPRLTEESVEQAVAVFNGQSHGYLASLVDGVTLLTPRSVPPHARGLLERRYRASGRTGSVEDAMFEITKLIEPEWGATGVVGSGPMPSQECRHRLDRKVTLRGTASVQELLGSVARQVPGVAWTLLYDDWDSSRFKLGFVCSDGSWSRWTLAPK